MQTTLQGLELSVAIVMDDLASAKEIASALRQNNILAHHYKTLEEFWVGTYVQIPELVIIDVTKMSQGNVQFKNHPNILNKSMGYVFFSKDSTKILLQSTYELNPYSYLHLDPALASQVTALVSRRANEIKREKEIKDVESRMKRLEARSQRLISERSSAEEFRSQFDFIRSFCADIEAESARQDYTTALLSKLEQWESVECFGIYELNQNGQKLVAPEMAKKKYHAFPALWLGQTNLHGIENFAQDMAIQVANDLFEIEPIMIKIHAGNNNPDILLFISSSEERMKTFPWDVFESMLSSSLRRLRLYQQLPQYASQFMPMWEALDNMDRLQKAGVESETRILCLSLLPLTCVAKKRIQNKFYWSSFFNDFFLQLSGRLQKTTKLSLMGPWHVIFFIPKENMETETQMLQTFVRQFGYWKFFEDGSTVLSEEMLPVMKLVPPSSAHYLRTFEKEFEEMAAAAESKRLISAAQSPANRISF